MKKFTILFIAVFFVFLGVSAAWAPCGITGFVYCDVDQDKIFNNDDIPLSGVVILLDGDAVATTGENGMYSINSHDLCNGQLLSLDEATLPEEYTDYSFVNPPDNNGVEYAKVRLDSGDPLPRQDFGVYDDACVPVDEQVCWLTAGGVKFDPIGGPDMATNSGDTAKKGGPKDSVGGVAYPGCSPEASNGGQWNHVAHNLDMHLTGKDIQVERCGNVPGIDPGSESPVCSVNFIEFKGQGVVKGIHGNKMDPIPVEFWVRAEDRNEPGNEHSATAGEDIDRYYLIVVDGDGNIVFEVDEDGNPGAVDPLTITGGNFQIHCTSCD